MSEDCRIHPLTSDRTLFMVLHPILDKTLATCPLFIQDKPYFFLLTFLAHPLRKQTSVTHLITYHDVTEQTQ